MDTVELVKRLCKERGIPISRLERDCGFANGYIRKLKEGKLPSDRLAKVANYLNISVDYLLTGEEKDPRPYFLDDEAREIAEELSKNPNLHILFDAARTV